MDDFELATWMKFFTIMVVGLGSVVILFFLLNSYVSYFIRANAGTSTLLFEPSNKTVAKGEQINTQVILNTNSNAVSGVELALRFDPAKLTLVHMKPVAQDLTSFKTYLPFTSPSSVFNAPLVVKRANKSGEIRLSAVTADMREKKVNEPFTGLASLVELTFVARETGDTQVSFITTNPTKDSAVVQNTGKPTNILTKTNTLTVTIENP